MFKHRLECLSDCSFAFVDNVFAIKSWAKRKFGFEDGRLDKAFGIPEEFDYLD